MSPQKRISFDRQTLGVAPEMNEVHFKTGNKVLYDPTNKNGRFYFCENPEIHVDRFGLWICGQRVEYTVVYYVADVDATQGFKVYYFPPPQVLQP